MASVQEIQFVKTELDFNRLLAAKKYVVANFTAAWCGPCQASKPAVDKLYNQAKYAKIEIIRVDMDDGLALARKYSIRSVPTFVFFENQTETERVHGFTPEFQQALDRMNSKAAGDVSVTDRNNQVEIVAPGCDNSYKKEIEAYIPKGFETINDAIHFGEMVTLNAMPLNQESSEAKEVFKPALATSTVYSDADAQALFFVPLNHICKVYSVLLKVLKPQALEKTRLDADEISDETQSPKTVKIWANKPSVLSFEDCTGSDALHEETLPLDLAEGWHEIKLRYVRFQKVQNLNIFVEGEDEDSHTVIDKVVLVGLTGESTGHTAIHQDEE